MEISAVDRYVLHADGDPLLAGTRGMDNRPFDRRDKAELSRPGPPPPESRCGRQQIMAPVSGSWRPGVIQTLALAADRLISDGVAIDPDHLATILRPMATAVSPEADPGELGTVVADIVGSRQWPFARIPGNRYPAAPPTEGRGEIPRPFADPTLLSTVTGHEDWVTTVALGWVDGGPILATGSSDRTVRLWHPESGYPWQRLFRSTEATLTGHRGSVQSVAFGVVGQRTVLASGSHDGTIRLWDPMTGGHLTTLTGHQHGIASLAFGAIDWRSTLASGGYDDTVRLWDPHTGEILTTLTRPESPVNSVAFGTVGGRAILAAGTAPATVELWDAATGRHLNTLYGHQDIVTSVAFGTVCGQTMLASSALDAWRQRTTQIRIWDPTTGREQAGLQAIDGGICSVALGTVAGRAILASGGDHASGEVRLWDPTTGEHLTTLTGHKGAVLSVAFGSIGRRPALVTGSADRSARVWRW